jgi:hypothetical protein
MYLFELHRDTDDTGISGTGVVAQGVVFDDGAVALHWVGAVGSTALYGNMQAVEKIHGHGGKTRIVVTPTRMIGLDPYGDTGRQSGRPVAHEALHPNDEPITYPGTVATGGMTPGYLAPHRWGEAGPEPVDEAIYDEAFQPHRRRM